MQTNPAQSSKPAVLRVTYREDPLWVALGPHVGVMDLFENHPGLVVFPILEGQN